jgi:DNA-binding Xre family transcriptional regulator
MADSDERGLARIQGGCGAVSSLTGGARSKVVTLVGLLAEQGPTLLFPLLESGAGKDSEANAPDIRARHQDRGGQNDGAPRATEEDRAMKKPTSWDLYFQKQLGDPEMRGLIDEELESLRVGTQIARWRQKKGLSQAQLAARAGMSAPNISRIENSPAQNITLETLVKIARALGRGVEVTFPARRSS